MALAARLWRLLPFRRGAAPGSRLPAGTLGSRGHCGRCRFRGFEVMGNPGTFKRGLLLSALSYLGFETYQVISQAAVVHATAKESRCVTEGRVWRCDLSSLQPLPPGFK
ncbi:RMDN1 isoform 17 [Pan troglodytes]|uniref:RMDN1 isoform 17 n=1 Tax=Pan troglodytes TaxID=9598 RepID=A0A2J8PLG4_PANTR|nr:RMDN1 isoform 17 [Pan troglodytes]